MRFFNILLRDDYSRMASIEATASVNTVLKFSEFIPIALCNYPYSNYMAM